MREIVQRIAAKALIVNREGNILVLRKSIDDVRHAKNSRRYNLPGGKIEPGETLAAGLVREVREETGLLIGEVPPTPIFVGEWRPTVAEVPHQIVGLFFVCDKWSGTIKLNSEHDDYAWIGYDEIVSHDLLPPEDKASFAYFQSLSKK